MTNYEPYPTVTFAGTTTYADQTISSISVTMGRNDVTEQPQPGYASISLWTDANDPLDVALSQSVAISIDKGTSGTEQIFYGTISDINISIQSYGSEGSIAIYSITAVGPLAQLNRHLAGSVSFPKQLDGARVFDILTDAFSTSWSDVGATLTWQDLPNDVTWESYDAINALLVDNLATNVDAGVYELQAYNDGATNALSLAQAAAQSGRGVLWESGSGEILYSDYGSRQAAIGYELTADDFLARGLQTAAQWGEVVNQATLTYRAGETVARDEQSAILYGTLNGSRATQLHNLVEAENQARDFVSSRAYPRMYPEVLTIPLHSPTVSDATRDELAAVYNGLRIVTNDLPAVFGTEFDGFVEGWTWNITRYTAELSLICSAYSETYFTIIWNQEPANLTWASYTPTMEEWIDL